MLRKTRVYLNFIILISIIVAFVGCGGGGGGGGTPPPDGNVCEAPVEEKVTVQVLNTESQNPIDGADVHITIKDRSDNASYKTNSEGKITHTLVGCFDASDEKSDWPQFVTIIASKVPSYRESQAQDCPLGEVVCPSRVTDLWIDYLPIGPGYPTIYLWLKPL